MGTKIFELFLFQRQPTYKWKYFFNVFFDSNIQCYITLLFCYYNYRICICGCDRFGEYTPVVVLSSEEISTVTALSMFPLTMIAHTMRVPSPSPTV